MKRKASGSSAQKPAKRLRRTKTPRRVGVFVPPEFKYTVASTALTASTYNGLGASLLTNLARGDAGKDNFDGNQVVPVGLTVRFTVQATAVTQKLRFIIIQVLKGTAPLTNQLLDSTGGAATTYLSSYNRGYKNTFKVLTDKIINVTTANDDNISEVVYIPQRKIQPVSYITGTTNISTGDIRLYYYGDALASAQLSYYSEILFAD